VCTLVPYVEKMAERRGMARGGHYFATSLITAGADPTDVQRALRHASLRITLETYVH
jgi:integrase